MIANVNGRRRKIKLLENRPFHCHYCGKPFHNINEITMDHKTAKANGGGYHAKNIALACVRCNRRKGTMSESAFLALLESERQRGALRFPLDP